MYKFHNVAQNTDEWLEIRIGKVTSSSLATVMANFGKAFGEPAKKYALKIALERLTGKRSEYSFSNEHTERGHEQEPFARQAYEVLNFVDVKNGGFFECEKYGASPDGLVGDDGVIEIKSVIASTHFDNLKRGAIDPAYKWQCYANLKISGRKWIDFVSYCEDFTDNKKIIVYRIHASDCDEYFKMIDERLDEFHVLINETVEMIKSA